LVNPQVEKTPAALEERGLCQNIPIPSWFYAIPFAEIIPETEHRGAQRQL
jgi:hypothetical protein